MGDPDQQQPPRHRWLRVVRDGERSTPPPTDSPPDPPPGPPSPSATRDPGTWARPAARQTWTGTATAPGRLPAPADPPPAGAVPLPYADGVPLPYADGGPLPYADAASRPRPVTGPHAGAVRGSAPPVPEPRLVAPAARPDEAGAGSWGHVVRAAGMLVAVVGAGTAGAVLADRVVGAPGDGHPALYVLVALALPFWDALPARIGPRLAVVAVVIAAVAAAWFGLALLAEPAWWRAQVSFGLACLGVGTAHLLLAAALRRRTVAE